MVDVVDKISGFMNFRNLFIVAILISAVTFAMNAGMFTVTSSNVNLILMVFAGGSMLFWVVMIKNSHNILYRDAVMMEPMSPRAVDAQFDGRKRFTMFENDMVAWQWGDEPKTVHAMQVIEVKLSKMTVHDLNESELQRMTRDYEGIMNTGDVEIITIHARKKVQAKDWLSQMERKRDNLEFDAQLGGRATHGEKALQITSTLRRMKEGLENVYDSRFFVIVATQAANLDRVREDLKTAVNAIIDRLRDQLKLEVGILRGHNLEEATNFFRVYTALDSNRRNLISLKTFRTLSLDLGWQNPFAVPRLPPLSKLMRGIYIGHVLTTNQPVSWDPDDPEMPSAHALLIGPSVVYDEPIFVRENGNVSRVRIGEFVDRYFPDLRSAGPCYLQGVETLSMLPDGRIDWAPISYVYRHKTEGRLLKLYVQTGREITITEGHSIFIFEDGFIRLKAAADLRVGDHVVIPRRLPSQRAVPDPLKFQFRTGKAAKEFTRQVQVNAHLMRFLGYFVSEGHIAVRDNGSYRICFDFAVKDTKAIKKLTVATQKLFGVKPKFMLRRKNLRVYVYGKFPSLFLRDCIGVSLGVRNKSIPQVVWRAPPRLQFQFLKAYMEGDQRENWKWPPRLGFTLPKLHVPQITRNACSRKRRRHKNRGPHNRYQRQNIL